LQEDGVCSAADAENKRRLLSCLWFFDNRGIVHVGQKSYRFTVPKRKKIRRWGDDSLSTAYWTFSVFFRHQSEKCSLVNGELILSEW